MTAILFVFSGHKIFAPTGIGVLYGKPEVLANTPPWQGGNMIVDVTFEKTTYQPPPGRFEAGTGNIADAVGCPIQALLNPEELSRCAASNLKARQTFMLERLQKLIFFAASVLICGTVQSFPQSLPASLGEPPVFHQQVQLVGVDVLVLDKQGSRVMGLSAKDFQLREDGVSQQIVSLDEHRPRTAAVSIGTPALVSTLDSAVSVTNRQLAPPAVWNVILIDLLNSTKEDQIVLRRQLELFLKDLPPHEPLALVAMTDQIKIETSFADGAEGAAAFLQKNRLPVISSAPPADIDSLQDQLLAPQTPSMLQNKARVDVDRQAQRAQTTLGNFSAIAEWLKDYPGRKNIFWLSSGFPLQGQPFGIPAGAINPVGHRDPEQDTTDKKLQLAQAAVYPIDTRGVAPSDIAGQTNADTAGTFREVGSLVEVNKDNDLKTAQRAEMLDIAGATGGIASFNNDIRNTLARDFVDGSSYYTISYAPSNTDWNGAYRKIDLAVRPPGAQVTYRRGYYATRSKPRSIRSGDQFKAALRRGSSPEASVLFSARATRSANAEAIVWTIDPGTLLFEPDGAGNKIAVVDCAILEYDRKGRVLESSLIRLTNTLPSERLAALAGKSIKTNQSIPLKPGAVSLSLGVRDQTTGQFGTSEVALQPFGAGVPANDSAIKLKTRDPEALETEQADKRLVTLNVMVNGKDASSVAGMHQQDFAILDNGQSQRVLSFRRMERASSPSPDKVILVLDTINASFRNVQLQREGVEQYLRRNGGRLLNPTSIVFLTDRGLTVRQPTLDGLALAVDVEKLPAVQRLFGVSSGANGDVDRVKKSILDLTQLATYEATQPGRKLLVWIGPGWPLLSRRSTLTALDSKRYFDSIVDLNTRILQANITLYSVAPLDLYEATSNRTFLYQAYLKGVATASEADSPYLSVQVLAYQSGGQVLAPNGDLSGQIAQCIDDSGVYYELSFEQSSSSRQSELHTLEVTLAEAGLTARTRTVYYEP